ncbi:MAG: hypothetical protein ACRCVJ_11765 [Clostridium sp.]
MELEEIEGFVDWKSVPRNTKVRCRNNYKDHWDYTEYEFIYHESGSDEPFLVICHGGNKIYRFKYCEIVD